MKTFIKIIIMVLLLFIAFRLVAHAEPCPEGQYTIGDNICRAEPTGCPYGDSIPIDSPKCVPSKVDELRPTVDEVPTPVVNVTEPEQENWGK